MRKPFACAFVALALAVTAGCSSGTSPDTTGSSAGNTDTAQSAIQTPNPWHEAANAAEAGNGAFGDTFEVPETLSVNNVSLPTSSFSYMEDMAQANYQNDTASVCVRKGKNVSGQTLHGVYDEFEFKWIVDDGNVQVACSGRQKGIANLMEWHASGCGYSAYADDPNNPGFGITEADVPVLVDIIT